MFAALQPWNVMVPGSWGPPDKVYLFDDFVSLQCVTTNLAAPWDLLGTAPTVAASSVLGGSVIITANATDETVMFSPGSVFAMPAIGKQLYFETRVKGADADDAAWFLGLGTAADASPIAAHTDGIGFEKVVDVADLFVRGTNAGTETNTDTGLNVSDATWVRLAFQVDAKGGATFWVDGVIVARMTAAQLPVPGTALQPCLAISLDAGTADTLEIDYVLIAQDR